MFQSFIAWKHRRAQHLMLLKNNAQQSFCWHAACLDKADMPVRLQAQGMSRTLESL